MLRRGLPFVLAGALVGACLPQAVPPGVVLCASDLSCPSGLTCINGVCGGASGGTGASSGRSSSGASSGRSSSSGSSGSAGCGAKNAPCSAASCKGSMLTPGGICDGNGSCNAGQPTACPGNFTCNDAGTGCESQCAASAGCAEGFLCVAGSCVPPASAGGQCGDGGSAPPCQTGFDCLGGFCCLDPCILDAGACSATACAATTGDCVYPGASVSCGDGGACSGSSFTPAPVCGGAGACLTHQAPSACPGSLACASPTSCASSCASASDCIANFNCVDGGCVPPPGAGAPCSASDPCKSSLACLGGFCCATTCVVDSGVCAAAACSPDGGACVYPTQQCVAGTCSNDMATSPVACLNGACGEPSDSTCTRYVCNDAGTACLGLCQTSADCQSGFFCTGPNGSCEPLLTGGAACTQSADCTSGVCLGGACCLGECVQGGPCGATACTASGACNYPTATQCGAASCVGGVQTAAVTCTGGSCPQAVITPCGSFACGLTSCLTACSDSSNCAPGYYCSGDICVPQLDGGAACDAGSQCGSGSCLGGQCCASTCSADPTCGATACTADGGACVYPGASTVCGGGANCTGSTLTPAGSCAAGACVDGTPAPCPSGFSCASATACNTSCMTSQQCVPGGTCLGSSCLAPVAAGGNCSSSSECESDLCLGPVVGGTLDGTCCAGSCVTTGPCAAIGCTQDGGECVYAENETCSASSCPFNGSTQTSAAICEQGVCPNPVMVQCDPYVCNSGAQACYTSCTNDTDCIAGDGCNSLGACVPLTATGQACGAASACADGPCLGSVCCGSNCAVGGACGATACVAGTGACTYPSASTVCSVASCPDGGTVQTSAADCNGSGTCAGVTQTNCNTGYLCNPAGNVCNVSCTSNAQCATGYTCTGGACLGNPGTACGGNSGCASDVCLGGVCCTAVCTSPGVSPCGATACVSGTGACSYPPASTVCGAASCLAGGTTQTNTADCNGSGSCSPATHTNCNTGYACDAAAGSCYTSCSASADCANGYICSAGACVLPSSCLAMLTAEPSSTSGTYTILPPGQSSTSVYCDMSFDSGGWTLVESVNAGTCAPDNATVGTVTQGSCTYMPTASMEALANDATAVHIRTAAGAGPPTTYVTSVTAVEVQNMAAGNCANAGAALLADTKAEQEAQWNVVAGGNLVVGSMWFNCAVPETWPSVYHACGNGAGFHLVTNKSTWNFSKPNIAMEVYLR